MDRVRVHAAVDALLDAIEAGRPAHAPADEIVPFMREAITDAGLDYAPALVAAQRGELRTVWQGRRRFTTRAWLVAYVIALPPATEISATTAIEADENGILGSIRRRAAKKLRAVG